MTKQRKHVRKVGYVSVIAGRGIKDKWIGRGVWYKGEVYQVVRKKSNGKYSLVNRTFKKFVENVSASQLRLY